MDKGSYKTKMKDYGIEGVQNVASVADPRQERLSLGFAFVEFSSRAGAMLAYKRLQKHDVVFGHSERTAKVAFAEPLREPDPKVMAQVKSVFIDGLPPHWDEDRVRENLHRFGEIAWIMLARNMPTAKRNDFGFVDFSTHEAAVPCVEGVNDKGLGNGTSKGYDMSFMGRHFHDPYPYDDVDHRIKRPYYMMDQDPDLAEPSRHRPRWDQSDPVIPFHGNIYREPEDLVADGGFFRHNHYGSDYGGSSYLSFYGDGRTYGHGFYY